MTKLEKALSKNALEMLDQIRSERGIRTRAKALEVVLIEATRDLVGEQDSQSKDSFQQYWDEFMRHHNPMIFGYSIQTASSISEFQEELISLLSEVIAIKSRDFNFVNSVYIAGYHAWEIVDYENKFGFKLPRKYIDFLEVIGQRKYQKSFWSDPFFGGTMCLDSVFRTSLDFWSDIPEDLEISLPPKENTVFYYCDDVTIYEYFIANSDDPNVFHWNALDGVIDLECTFSERMRFLLEREIDYARTGIHKQSKSKSEYFRVP